MATTGTNCIGEATECRPFCCGIVARVSNFAQTPPARARILKLLPSRRRERPAANIGVYHVHPLCSRIPYYRLPRALRDHPELRGVGRLTLPQSFRCVRLV